MNNNKDQEEQKIPTLPEIKEQIGEIKSYMVFLRAISPQYCKKRFNKISHQMEKLLMELEKEIEIQNGN